MTSSSLKLTFFRAQPFLLSSRRTIRTAIGAQALWRRLAYRTPACHRNDVIDPCFGTAPA
jgi:hypothetical protein